MILRRILFGIGALSRRTPIAVIALSQSRASQWREKRSSARTRLNLNSDQSQLIHSTEFRNIDGNGASFQRLI
jgi:hypothetical protein